MSQDSVRGRRQATSAEKIAVAALRLFDERGYDHVTIDDIAAEVGVSRRTYFRYFASKAAVIWHDFDQEVTALEVQLGTYGAEVPLHDAIRSAVVAVNRAHNDDIPNLAVRMRLITRTPALAASATVHYDAWEQVIIQFAASRLGVPNDALEALTIGRTTLAAARAAYEVWLREGTQLLTGYLDRALRLLWP